MKFIWIIALAILIGCSTAPSMSYKEKNAAYQAYIKTNELNNLKKITTFRFHGWQSLTNKHLIISTSVKNKYLIEISGFCQDLMFTHGIIMNQSMSSVLSARFDSISMPSDPKIKCYIKSIYEINKVQAKELAQIGEPADDE